MLFMMQKTDAGLTSVVRRMRNLMIKQSGGTDTIANRGENGRGR